MPALIVARLYRIAPLIIILAIIGVLIYVIVSWRYTSAHAKDALTRVFIAINTVLTVFFGLASWYAIAEDNTFVMEFFVTCAAFTGIVLAITTWCRYVFLKHNPHFRKKKNTKAKTERLPGQK